MYGEVRNAQLQFLVFHRSVDMLADRARRLPAPDD
jgi:hypothetical protein